MVLFRSTVFNSAYSLNVGALNTICVSNITLTSLFFNLCEACEVSRSMAAIPPSAFSAGRIRETQRDKDMTLSNTMGRARTEAKFFDTSLLDLGPMKYNSKLMNSIWGFYNRYSPHNVKKINDAFSINVELPQAAGNSTNKSESLIPSPKLDNVWASYNISQSH